MIIPSVIETSARGERAFDIYSLLLRERIIFLGTGIDDQIANLIIAQLLYLEREDPEKDINLYIHSPGGQITAGLAIYDTMQLVRPDIATYAVGMTASMGTVLMCAGKPGKRYCMPNSTIHMHQALGGARGQAADIEIQAREILRMRHRLNTLYAKYTGQPIEAIELAMDRDKFLEADEAKTFGIIDEVFDRRPDATDGDTTGAAKITPA